MELDADTEYCPMCGAPMMPMHAHYYCPVCSYFDSCCDGQMLH